MTPEQILDAWRAEFAGIVKYRCATTKEFWWNWRQEKITITFVEGKVLDCIKRGYWDDGGLTWEDHYVDGLLHGPSRDYYQSGSIWLDQYYVNDVKHGQCKSYNKNGILTQNNTYVDGKRIHKGDPV